jgi:hypothetical protein
MTRLLSIFGALVLGAFGYASYTGWTWSSYEEIRNVPKSIRDNPGTYRSVYARYPHK